MIDFILRVPEEFLFQLVIAELVFCMNYKKRSRFLLRIIIFAAVMIIGYDFVLYYIPHPGNQFIINILICIVFAMTVCWLWWCYDCQFNDLLFRGVGAYAMQNLGYNTWRIMKNLTGFSESSVKSSVMVIIIFGSVYTLVYVVLIREMDRHKMKEINRFRNLINAIFILILTTFFSTLIPEINETGYLLNLLYAVVGDILILCIQFDMLIESKLQRQNEILEQILIEEKNQYQTSKENIELINMKCHDLKYQIQAIRRIKDEEMREEAIKEIEQAILLYDSSIKTGNDTLDVLFMEKLLICEKHRIKLTCIADGAGINFMKPYDIYSVFGNLIDNAIESVSKEKDEGKRIISLNIGRKGKLLKIHVENYFVGSLKFEGELPETTKDDKHFHGYGMMSVRYVIKKYGGNMVVSQEDNLFVVNILIPLP